MMLLGGGPASETRVLNLGQLQTPQTVVGYIATVGLGQGAPLPDPTGFITRVNQHNVNLPANLFLICGDGNLEPMATID